MVKKIFFLLSFCAATLSFAQKGGPAVFSVDGDTIWGAEFERVFSKNDKTPDVRPTMDELEDYLNLYVRFKLKVKEAYTLGMDTNEVFIKELAGYRKQLAQPYLTDKTVTDKLIQEAYDRMKIEVEASNLMIHLSPAASPEDTLEAWNRMNRWKELINSGAKTFEEITRDSSSDEHGRKNEGRLGYFSVFNMIYPFETVAYNTPVGQVSAPFRTQFGYHMLKVTNKRATREDIKVAHILIRINNESEYETNKPRIDALYERLKKGEDFGKLVHDFSEDFDTRESGGQLNWIKSLDSHVPVDFREAAYSLKEGAFSKPVKSPLGWHIIKRIEQKPFPELNMVKETIKMKIGRDSRSELNKSAVLKRIQAENKYTVNTQNLNQFVASLADTAMFFNWVPGSFHKSENVLFTIADKKYTCSDFSSFIKSVRQSPSRNPNESMENIVKLLFTSYSDNKNFEYEEGVLESKYDDFKYLMQEYRDGILLFELSNKTVWNKASEDNAGLKAFFEGRREMYIWKDRVVTKSYVCSSKSASKLVKKYLKKDSSDKAILLAVNKEDALGVNIVYKTYEKGQEAKIDKLDWNKKLHKIKDKSTNNTEYVKIEKLIDPTQKELKETLGPVTSDYQKYLEDKWIESLKLKYSVVTFDGALDQLFLNK